jgi:hypothetical protein
VFLSRCHIFWDSNQFIAEFCFGISTKKKKLHGLSPRANYTDRATAACRRSDCQLLRIERCHVVSVMDPYGRILGFLDSSRYSVTRFSN